jgi:hypothetical protein
MSSTKDLVQTFLDRVGKLDQDREAFKSVQQEFQKIWEPFSKGSSSKFVKKRATMDEHSLVAPPNVFWWGESKQTNGLSHSAGHGLLGGGELTGTSVITAIESNSSDFAQSLILKRAKTMPEREPASYEVA